MVKLCLAPLIHGSAQWTTLMSLFVGDTVVLLPAFDTHEIWQAVGRHKVNVLVVVGDAMARPLIEAFDPEQVRRVVGVLGVLERARCSPSRSRTPCLTQLPNTVITDAIGSSETGFTGISFVEQGRSSRRAARGSAPARDTIVIDDDGKPGRPREIGRLARGGHIPLGYYKDPVKTAAMFVEVDGERYVVPGDFAGVEADGTITLLGRGNTCVNTGGEKVFPEEVEGAIKAHPAVFDALVIGIPDERLGQRVAAIVQPREGENVDLAELERPCAPSVAGYKVPRTIWLTDQHRPHPSGKADYVWAALRRCQLAEAGGAEPWQGELRCSTPLCERFGIEHPIFGFTPSEHVAAAISRAGGLGVLGCVRYNDADDLEAALTWMDAQYRRPAVRRRHRHAGQGARPKGRQVDLSQLIPASHREFVEKTLLQARRAAAAADGERRDGVLGWLHSVARAHVEVALAHPVKLIANALGSPPDDVIEARTSRASRSPRWPARPSTRRGTSAGASTSWSRRATRPAGTPARSPAWCWSPRSSTRSAPTSRCSRPAASARAARSSPRSRSARPGCGWARTG